MTRRISNSLTGTLHALVVIALAACGSTDPPGPTAFDAGPGAEVKLPKALSLTIESSGAHYHFQTEGFGRTVAVSGARVAVADYLDWQQWWLRYPHVDTFEIVDGAASQTGKLPAVGWGELCFGEAIGLAGDLLAIGEPCANAGAGEVHVYRMTGGAWVEEPTLRPAAPAGFAGFGMAIAMAANRMVVGAPLEDGTGPLGEVLPRVGSAYAYVRSGGAWVASGRIAPSDGRAHDSFGTSLSMNASALAVGAPGRWNGDALGNPVATNGKAYVFSLLPNGSWSETAGLSVTDAAPADWVGGTVALCSGTLFVGSDAWAWPAVHAFEVAGNRWAEGDLLDPAPTPNGFVHALACDGDFLAVGMPFLGPPEAARTGAARFFKKVGGTWVPAGEIAGAVPDDYAGYSVAVDGTVVAVGIPQPTLARHATGVVRVQRF